MKPKIKFGDILTFTDEWYRASGRERPDEPALFVATGKIKEEMPGHYCIYVVGKNKSYVSIYYCSYLVKEVKDER